MNIKKEVFYVFSILIIFGFVLNFAYAGIISEVTADVSTFSAYTVDNWTKGGENKSVSFTLNFNNGEYDTISNITLYTPGNVLLTNYFVAANLTNITTSDGYLLDSWSCELNATLHDSLDFMEGIACQNQTATTSLNTSLNSSVIINLEVYYNATGTEETVDWKFEVSNSSGGVATDSVIVSTNIDNLAPRLIELNVSDGYTTIKNGTTGKFLFNFLNQIGDEKNTISNGTLRGDGILTVTAEFDDAGANAQTMLTDNNVYLYYNTTGNASEGGEVAAPILMTTSDSITPYKFTGIINGLTENEIVTFVFVVNDTFNNKVYQNNTQDGAAPFAALINTTNVPVLTVFNISDGTYNISSLSGGYLTPGTQTFTINTEGRDVFGASIDRDLSTDGVLLYYNTTGNLTVGVNGYVTRADAQSVLLANNTVSGYSAIYSGSASIVAGNDTNTVYWAIVANTSTGTYYTLLTGQYTIDDSSPTGTAVTSDDTDNRISIGDTVTFTCSASDVGSGLKSTGYIWNVNLGGSDTQIIDQTDTTLTLTSSSSSMTTNKAGDYIAKCTPYDLLGHAGTEATLSYIVTASTGGSSSSGGGSSSSSTTATFDADLSIENSASMSGNVGRIRSFSFDGTTKHTLTFKEITANSAKIEIASTPIEVLLNVGESKEVDLNADGTNDLKVTLDGIKFGSTASVSIEKLEEGAKKVVEEDREAAGLEPKTGEEPTTEPKSAGRTWWIILLVIVILAVVLYYAFKKKK